MLKCLHFHVDLLCGWVYESRMYLRKKLEAKIADQQRRIAQMERETSEAKSYLSGIQDALKMLPPDGIDPANATLREGSELAKVRDTLRKEGKPLHIDELLKRMGKEVNRNTKGGLAGSVGDYAKKGRIFTKTAPNTFGLIEFDISSTVIEPPEEFGLPKVAGAAR
jgi:hypothetical protein